MNQAQLPWEAIPKENLASRQDIRDDKAEIRIGKSTYFVKLEKIKEYEGYNGRMVYEGIEELADSLDANGLTTPLTVRMEKDRSKHLIRGNRRIKAIEVLAQRYADRNEYDKFFEKFGWVECFFTDTNVSELDLVLDQFTSNDYKPFTPVENGRNVGILKSVFNLTHEEIAKKTGASRQTIDNWAKVDELPQETKDAINRGELSMNKALAELKKEKKEKMPKFSTIELPPDTRDEEQSSMGKGVGQTIALQKDRGLDAETQAAADEEKLFQANSEEQDMLNRQISNADSIQVKVKKLEAEHPKLVEDIQRLCEFIVNDLIKVREVLAKLQKN